MKYITNRTLFLPAAIAVMAGFGSCASSDAREETAAATTPAAALAVFTLQPGQLSSRIQIPGELQAFQQVDLYAKVSSFVKKIYVDVGSQVKAGQLLATMEAPELNAQLAGAESRLKSQEAIYLASKATYDRLLETSRTPGTVSQNDLDLAYAKQKSDLAQLDAAKASRKETGEQRNYLEIRAPFDGIISARNVSAGAYVGPSGKGSELPIFTLQEQGKLRLVVSVPEAYAAYLNSRTETEFAVKSLPGRHFKAKVSRLAGALDNRLRAQRIEMDVPNSEGMLLPGMVAEVSVALEGSPSAFVVPASAVLHSTRGTFVIKVAGGKTLWTPVVTGNSTAEQTEVFGALQARDVLVTQASEEVRDSAAAGPLRGN